ncbi:MAG: cytochrome c family protein [Gammaproteobacteria bacterium]|nr:cytochrome c family protein [Gammaproteobacteria bacterium]
MAQATAQTSTPAAAMASQAESPQLKRGRLLFLQCRACHELHPMGAALVGPHLGGLLGRKAASVAGFGYSAALSAQDFTWDRGRLDHWLTSPGKMVPGNAMAFAGVASDADRAALIAFLETATAITPGR